MNINEHIELSSEQLSDFIIKIIEKQIKTEKPDLLITCNTRLKEDAELDVFHFGDVLVNLFYETDWMIRYEILIGWFAKNDCSVEELADKILFVKNQYKENEREV